MTSLISILGLVPMFAVWVVAVVLAASRWSKHPTVSALVVTGGALQVVASLAHFVVPMTMEGLGMQRDGMMLMFAGLGVISTGGLACVIAAVFAERTTRADPPIR